MEGWSRGGGGGRRPIAGPRGWPRASGTVKDKRTLVERGSESYRRGVECTSFFVQYTHFYIYVSVFIVFIRFREPGNVTQT